MRRTSPRAQGASRTGSASGRSERGTSAPLLLAGDGLALRGAVREKQLRVRHGGAGSQCPGARAEGTEKRVWVRLARRRPGIRQGPESSRAPVSVSGASAAVERPPDAHRRREVPHRAQARVGRRYHGDRRQRRGARGSSRAARAAAEGSYDSAFRRLGTTLGAASTRRADSPRDATGAEQRGCRPTSLASLSADMGASSDEDVRDRHRRLPAVSSARDAADRGHSQRQRAARAAGVDGAQGGAAVVVAREVSPCNVVAVAQGLCDGTGVRSRRHRDSCGLARPSAAGW